MTPTKNESLPELVARWREAARSEDAYAENPPKLGGLEDDPATYRMCAVIYRLCAEQLEAALTREAHTEGVVSRARGIIGDIMNCECSVAALQDAHDLLTTALLPTILTATPPAPQRLAQGEDNFLSRWTKAIREMPMGGRPPHHDQGEVNREWRESLRASLKRYGFPRPELTRPVACDDGYWTPWHVALETLEAALTEAKQQGPGEAVKVWRISKVESGREFDAWEVYNPDGGGGVVSMYDVKDWVVRDLLNALATAPQVEAKQQTGEG